DITVQKLTGGRVERVKTSLIRDMEKIPSVERVVTRDVLAEVTESAYSTRSGVFQIMWLVLLMTVIILAWTQGASMSIEMRREIGILKAIGWGIADVVETRMLEALIIGITGVLAGMIGGLTYLLAGAPGMKGYFMGWSSVYPEFPIPVHITIRSVLLIMVVGIIPLLVATLIPAWLAGIIEPDEAIRK
ncbi:ABC transporter permease, partial [Acidobacteriota bacterium]